MVLPGRFRLVAHAEHDEARAAAAGHRPFDRLARAQAEQGAAHRREDRDLVGAAVGVNFIPVDPFLLSVEVTGDYVWGNNLATGEFFANLRAGAVVTDSVLVYAIGGVGVQTGPNNAGSAGLYQLGAGVEFAVTDAITVRGEVVGQGDFANTGAADNFFDAAKATVGVYYHF